jgi:hypothetical protein
MDAQTYINAALAVICAGIGWFARTLWDGQQKLKDELSALHVKVAEEYVPNTRFESVLREINENIKLVLNKLDGKADK